MIAAFFNQTVPSSIADDAMRLWRCTGPALVGARRPKAAVPKV
jgi:hypothetical protein